MKGILFTSTMITAIQEGRKTQTRRIIKELQEPDEWEFKTVGVLNPANNYLFRKRDGDAKVVHPRYRVGQVVYVKEAHYAYGSWVKGLDGGWSFIQDGEMAVQFMDGQKWGHAFTKPSSKDAWYQRSPLFLKEKDARYFLKILEVGLGRVQEITEEDAIAEGMKRHLVPVTAGWLNPVEQFNRLWDRINAKIRPEDRRFTLDSKSNRHFIKDQISPNSWGSNPWCIRYKFVLAEGPK